MNHGIKKYVVVGTADYVVLTFAVISGHCVSHSHGMDRSLQDGLGGWVGEGVW